MNYKKHLITLLASSSLIMTGIASADELSDKQADLATVTQTITDYSNQLSAKESELSSKESELSSAKTTLQSTKDDANDTSALDTVREYVEKYKELVATRQNDLKSSWNLVKLQEGNVSEFFANTDTKLSEYQEKLDYYQKRYDKLADELGIDSETSSKISEQEQAVKSLESSVSTLKSEVSDLKTKKSDAESSKSQIESQIKELESNATTTTESKSSDTSTSESSSTTKAISNSSSDDSALYESASSVSSGETEHVAKMKSFLASKYGVEVGGYRAGDTDGVGTGHGDGLALDVMVPVGSDLGDEVAQYMVDNFDTYGVNYIIWEQKFYSPLTNIYGSGGTWNMMPDRGSVTQNHYDHVHISFKY